MVHRLLSFAGSSIEHTSVDEAFVLFFFFWPQLGTTQHIESSSSVVPRHREPSNMIHHHSFLIDHHFTAYLSIAFSQQVLFRAGSIFHPYSKSSNQGQSRFSLIQRIQM